MELRASAPRRISRSRTHLWRRTVLRRAAFALCAAAIIFWLAWRLCLHSADTHAIPLPTPLPNPPVPHRRSMLGDVPLPPGVVRRASEALMADDAAHTLRRVAADVQLLHRRLLPESLAEDYAHNLEDMIDVPEPAVSPLRLQQLTNSLDVLQQRAQLGLAGTATPAETEPPPDALIGILSARDHFELRQAQRETWLRWVQDNPAARKRVKHVFVIGATDCELPVEDRDSPYSCEPRSAQAPIFDVRLAAASVTGATPNQRRFWPPPIVGMEVSIKSWATITQLGIYDAGADGWTQDVRVRLYDRNNDKQPVLEAVFSPQRPGMLRHGFRYLEVTPVTLPRGFEAVFTAQGMAESDYFLHDVATVHYHDGGGILHFGGALKYGVVTTQLPAARAAGKLSDYAAISFMYEAPSKVPGTMYAVPWRPHLGYNTINLLACDTLRLTSPTSTSLLELASKEAFEQCRVQAADVRLDWSEHAQQASGSEIHFDIKDLTPGEYYFVNRQHCAEGMKVILVVAPTPELQLEADQQRLGRTERRRAHESRLQETAATLQAEMAENGDILLLPQFVDTYRNLPQKLLAWLRYGALSRAKLLLKTDDDVIVDVERVLAVVDSLELLHARWTWWGAFRVDWPVDRSGKWRESRFIGQSYPPFACGSGHILTRDLALALVQRASSVNALQGEDVSLGAWLMALAPDYLTDLRWHCFGMDHGCDPDALASPEHSPASIRAAWAAWLQCKNMCGCS